MSFEDPDVDRQSIRSTNRMERCLLNLHQGLTISKKQDIGVCCAMSAPRTGFAEPVMVGYITLDRVSHVALPHFFTDLLN